MKKSKYFFIVKKLVIITIISMLILSAFSINGLTKYSKAGVEKPPKDPGDGDGDQENYPPYLMDIPGQTIAEGSNFAEINLHNYVFNPGNSENELTWTVSGNFALTVEINEEIIHNYVKWIATINYPSGWTGDETLTFTATDPEGLFDSDSASFKVLMLDEREFTFAEGIKGSPLISSLDSSRFLVVYKVEIEGSNEHINKPPDWTPYVCLGTVNSDGSISFGESYDLSGSYYYSSLNLGPKITVLDNSHFVVSTGKIDYGVGPESAGVICRVGIVNSDGSITLGDIEVIGYTHGPTYHLEMALGGICALDSNHFVASYNKEVRVVKAENGEAVEYNRWTRYFWVGEVSGTNIERVALEGKTIAESTNGGGADKEGKKTAEIITLDSSHFLASYKKKNDFYTCIYSYTPSTLGNLGEGIIVKGPSFKCENKDGVSDIEVLDSSHFLLGRYGATQIATISGETITYGDISGYCPTFALAGLDSNHFAAVSCGYARIGAVSGSSFNLGYDIEFNTGSTAGVSADSLDNSRFVVGYNEESVGMAVVLSTSDDDPIAVDDCYNVDENIVLDVTSPGLLSNDENGNLDSFSAIKISNPLHGSVTLNSDGSFVYTPDGNYNGYDEFTYKINNGIEDSNIAKVNINVISETNIAPDKPTTPNGEGVGKANTEYSYASSATDSDGNQVFYLFNWGDNTDSGWLGPYDSGESCEASHTWDEHGNYEVKVKAKDTNGDESEWSETITVNIQKSNVPKFCLLILRFLDNHPNLFPILRAILGL